MDAFNSCPDYFGDVLDLSGKSVTEFDENDSEDDLSANFDVFESCCRGARDRAVLENALSQFDETTGEIAFVFAEERLSVLAPLLGIEDEKLNTDFVDFDDIELDEFEAVWVGKTSDGV